MAKQQSPHDLVILTAGKLRMFQDHGGTIFKDDDERDALLNDAARTVQILLDFRNIINGMVSLREMPKDAARPYIDE